VLITTIAGNGKGAAKNLKKALKPIDDRLFRFCIQCFRFQNVTHLIKGVSFMAIAKLYGQ
jgi:hypothetical protein